MTSGSPYRLILSFTLPMLLGNIFQQLYNMVDSIVVGNVIGDQALAAVGTGFPIIYMLSSLFIGIGTGATVMISQFYGARDLEKVEQTVNTIYMALFVGIVPLTVIGILLSEPLLRLMQVPDDGTLQMAKTYMFIIFIGVIGNLGFNINAGILQGFGDSRTSLLFLVIATVLNIILDLAFTIPIPLGVAGVALATIISQALSAVLCVMHLAKKGTIYQLKLSALRIDGPLLREILRYGLPAGIQNSVIGLANVVVQTNINSFGKMATAAYGAYSKIEGFAFLPVTSFTMAITTYVGQNLGAGMKPRARKGAIFGIAAAAVIAEIIGVITYLAAPWLVSLFSRTPEVIRLGVLETRIICLFYCLLAFSHAIASVCRGAGKAFVPMTIMLGVWCVFRILYITAIMHWRHEIVYVYWAYPITWAISSVIYLFYFLFSNWQDGFDPQPELPEHKHHHHLFHHHHHHHHR